MKLWLRLVVAFAALAALGHHTQTFSAKAKAANAEVTRDDNALGEREQAESTFACDVVERATDPTNDDFRALDVNVNGLLAVQAAIYAIPIVKLNQFSIWTQSAFVIAIALGCINLRP